MKVSNDVVKIVISDMVNNEITNKSVGWIEKEYRLQSIDAIAVWSYFNK